MTPQEAIEQLGNLKVHCDDFGRDDEESPFYHDVFALEIAIEAIKENSALTNKIILLQDELLRYREEEKHHENS